MAENKDSISTPNKSSKRLRLSVIVILISGLAGSLIYSYWLKQTAASQICQELKMRVAFLEAQPRPKPDDADWANLKFYREANAKLPPPPESSPRVVFFGDSITDWWDDPNFGGGDFFPGKPYVNRGIGGQTTSQMLVRFRQDVVSLKPKVVVILGGVNDIALSAKPVNSEPIKNNFISMTELARASGIEVVLASVLPVNDYERDKDGELYVQTKNIPPEQIKALNGWMKEYAGQNDFTYLDYYSALSDDKGFLRKGLSVDGLHPNAEGYAVMTPLVERAINSALK